MPPAPERQLPGARDGQPLWHIDVAHGALRLTAIVLSLDGTRTIRAESRGAEHEAARHGTAVADDLLSRGAAEILAEVQQAHAAVEGIQP